MQQRIDDGNISQQTEYEEYDERKLFKKHYAKMRKEAVLKSGLIGLAAGFGALAIVAFICWLTEFSPVWICPSVSVACALATAIPLYFLVFRPTEKSFAYRMDSLGLDERMTTMCELRGVDTPMARLQRRDALQTAAKVDSKLIKIVVSTSIIVAASVCAFVSAGALTVEVLAEADVIKSGKQLIEGAINPPAEYTVAYAVEGKGKVYVLETTEDGEVQAEVPEQTIVEGGDGRLVYTQPDDGWFLAGWKVNGQKYVMGDPYRQEMAVNGVIKVTAVFEELEAPEEDPGLGVPSGSGSGGNGNGEEGEEGENGEPNPGGGTGSGLDRSENANKVINGETDFTSTFDQDSKNIANKAGSDGDLSQGEKDLIGSYIGVITP